MWGQPLIYSRLFKFRAYLTLVEVGFQDVLKVVPTLCSSCLAEMHTQARALSGWLQTAPCGSASPSLSESPSQFWK